MKIFSGTSNPDLADSICAILNKKTLDESFTRGRLKIDKFLDGEILPLFEESVRGEDILFVQSTTSSDTIMETLLVIDAAKRADCKSFTLITPFQGYSRQDKTDHLRSSIGSKMLADILETVGMSRIITVDLHASSIQGFYNVPIIHLNGNKIFIEHIRKNQIEDLTIIAPDQGAVKRASDFCKAFPESTFAMINKKRIRPNEIHSMELVGDVEGRNVVIVDDMADTLGTLKKASELIMAKGAKSVRAIATHGILSGAAMELVGDVEGRNVVIVDDMADTLGTLKKASELIMAKGAKSVRAIATHGILSGAAMENLYSSQLTELMVSDSIPSTLQKEKDQVGDKLKVISCDNIIARTIWGLTTKRSIHEINMI